MELLGKYVLIGEGVRGSLAEQLTAKFDLQKDREPQKFGIGYVLPTSGRASKGSILFFPQA